MIKGVRNAWGAFWKSLRLKFNPKVDVGHFLTFIALVAGFVGAGINAKVERDIAAKKDAGSGALRVMLHILRERNAPISIDDLYNEFASDKNRELRLDYCETDYHFRNRTIFEAAVYRLDGEHRIRFITPDRIAFRVDGPSHRDANFYPNKADAKQMLSMLNDGLHDPQMHSYELQCVAEACLKLAPGSTHALLRRSLMSTDVRQRWRAAGLVSELLPDDAKLETSSTKK